ncbi:nitrate/nitrite transporter [Arthrobacter sp. NA-172]|uniref:MFS transporter n=1 Tax=Arthrobacter sp. NA-172 TaxID=3367524 RepID=UPI00375405DF
MTTALTPSTSSQPEIRNAYRWMVLLLCWFSFTMTSVDRSTWGPSSVFVGESLAIPLASLGIFATTYYIGYVVSNAAGGFLTDKIGGRLLITVSMIGAGIFMMVFGSTTSAVVGIAIQGVVGFFAGADYAAGIKLLSSWFRPEELGKVMGIFTSATSLGVVIANFAVPFLIAHSGWGASYHLFGAASVVSGILCWIILRPGPVAAIAANAAGSAKRPSAWRILSGNRNLLLVGLAGFGGFWGTYGFVIWSNALMIKGHGVAPATAGIIVAVFAALGVFGKPIIGFVADRFNGARRVPSIIVLGGFAVMLIIFGTLDSVPAFLIAAPLLGLTAYCYLPMIVALIPRLVSSDMVGTAAGLTNAIWQLGSVLVPIAVGGVFAASNNSFMAALGALAVGPLIGMVAMFFVNERPDEVKVIVKTEA